MRPMLKAAAAIASLAAILLPVWAEPAVRVLHSPRGGQVPDAEIDSGGAVHLAFVVGEDAYYCRSTDDGAHWSEPLRINAEPGTVHPSNSYRGPDLALGRDGRVHVIWYVNAYQRKLPQDQWGVYYAHLDPAAKTFSAAINLNHKASDNYSLAANVKGEVAVVWMAGNLMLTESRDNGVTFRESEEINLADPCECCASRALYAPDGSLYISYREKASNMRDMYLLRRAPGASGPIFSRSKTSVTPWQINACPMTGTFLGWTGGVAEPVVAWETKGAVYYRPTGNSTGGPKAGGEIQASPRGKWPLALSRTDGTTLVSWKNGSELAWRLFDGRGKSTGEKHSAKNSNANRHAGVITTGGTFLLID